MKEPGGRGRLAEYVGDRACAECHPGESKLHAGSGHARTLQRAAEMDVARWLDGRTVQDPERPAAVWTYALRGGRLSVERTEAGKSESFPIDYGFGSGNNAVTFLTMTERDKRKPAAVEHRLTAYTEAHTVDMTPGQDRSAPASGTTPTGRVLPSTKVLRCFHCHTTQTSAEGPEVLDVSTMIPNVSCESCHGPARDHVEAARRGKRTRAMPLGSDRSTADSQMRACGVCHRHPDQTPRAAIRTDNIEIVRQQPIGLMQSACFKRGDGAISCTTCHDAHGPTSRDRAAYVNVCLSCHESAPRRPCPVSPREGCLECHMPRRNSGQGVLFTDHWIRVVKDPAEKDVGPRP